MPKAILQVNYDFTMPHADFISLVTPLAEPLSAVPGLIWKIWLTSPAEQAAGGIYLFENAEAANAFMASQAIADFAAQPGITNIRASIFEPDERLSAVTRGPLGLKVGV
jgi:hypothetical protein